MAASTTLKGTNYTEVAKVTASPPTASAEVFVNAAQMWGTKLRVQYDTYEADAAYDAGSVISMGLIPKGARVLAFYCANEAVGAAVTADISLSGTAATAAEAWTDMTSANQQVIPALEAVSNAALTADSIVQVTTAAATFASGKSIVVATLYIDED